MELLSPGTEAEDLGQTLREVDRPPSKWQVYEQILRVPYYVVFDRYHNQFRLFRLSGLHYQEIALTDTEFWFDELSLGLGVSQGSYENVEGSWLRWYDRDRQWIPFRMEQIERERLLVLQSQARVEQERERADRLAAKLRELGIDPD